MARTTTARPSTHKRKATFSPREQVHAALAALLNGGEPGEQLPMLSHSRTDILAEAADAAIARKFHLQCGDVLLRLEAQLYARDGRVVDYSISQFVPGHFHFHVVRRVGGANNKPTG